MLRFPFRPAYDALMEQDLLQPLRSAGIDLFVEDRQTTQLHVVHPSTNVDERQVFLVKVDVTEGEALTGTRNLEDHTSEDSLRFAAALTSIKMESTGPLTGSLQDVLERMREHETSPSSPKPFIPE